MGLERIDPGIAHAIGELLLLPPQYRIGQIAGEGFAQELLFDAPALLAGQLHFRVQRHRRVDETPVQIRHARFHAPGRHRLVGAQAVEQVQIVELAHGFLVQCLRTGCLVEIQIAAEQLVRALAGKHHLDAHRADAACHQIHRSGGADRGDVVGFQVVDHVRQRVDAFLHGEMQFVVHGADVRGDFARSLQVGRISQADGKTMQLRPPGFGLAVFVHAPGGVLLGDRRHQRGIQPAGQQHAVGYVAHHVAAHRRFQRMAQRAAVRVGAGHAGVVAPARVVVGARSGFAAEPEMPRRKFFCIAAKLRQRLQFGGDVEIALCVVAAVQRDDADRVARHQPAVMRGIAQHKGEHAFKAVQPLADRFGVAAGTVQRQDHFTVRMGLEIVRGLVFGAERAVVVDLAIDRQCEGSVGAAQGLGATVHTDDGQALMNQDRARIVVDAGPVRAAVAHQARLLQRLGAQRGRVGRDVEDAEDRTHGGALPVAGSEARCYQSAGRLCSAA